MARVTIGMLNTSPGAEIPDWATSAWSRPNRSRAWLAKATLRSGAGAISTIAVATVRAIALSATRPPARRARRRWSGESRNARSIDQRIGSRKGRTMRKSAPPSSAAVASANTRE